MSVRPDAENAQGPATDAAEAEPAKATARVVAGGERVPELDGLRGVAILLVMVYHFVLYGGWRPVGPVETWLYRVATTGWIGVDLFFVLSGFLITGILYDAKGGGRYFRSFYARRVLRIFPLYYGFLAAYFALAPFLSSAGTALREGQTWYWTYLVNVDIALHGWPDHYAIAHFWSLAVEEQFYLLWPLVVFLFGRKGLLRVCVLCVLGALALRIGLGWYDHRLAAYVLMPARIDALAIGGWLAVMSRGGDRQRLARWEKLVATGGALFVLAVFVRFGRFAYSDPIVSSVGFSVLAVTFAAILHRTVRTSPRWLADRRLILLGTYSYALYVLHHPVILFLRGTPLSVDRLPRWLGSQLPAQLLVTLAAGLVSVVLAALSWRLWERPFLRLKRRFPYRSRTRRT